MDVSVKYISFIYSDVKRYYAYECVIVLNKVIDNSNDINKYIIFQTKLSHHVSYIDIWYHDLVADVQKAFRSIKKQYNFFKWFKTMKNCIIMWSNHEVL